MELRHLRYFVAVAEERNFTRAAERLHIAQPPLSRQIQQLEEDLGVVLIEKGARPLRLTEAGAFFYAHAKALLDQVHDLRTMTQRVGKLERKLSVGFVASTLYGLLPDIIRRYREAHPEVDMTLHEMTTVEQLKALKEGRIDVGFGRIKSEDASIRRILLREEPMVVALFPGHRLAVKEGGLRLTRSARALIESVLGEISALCQRLAATEIGARIVERRAVALELRLRTTSTLRSRWPRSRSLCQ